MDNGSRMTRECHVRFCERLRVKLPGPTHLKLMLRAIAVMEIKWERESQSIERHSRWVERLRICTGAFISPLPPFF